MPIKTDYSREELLSICDRSFVDHDKWSDRDTAQMQRQLGECYVLLKDGCEFKILFDGNSCNTDEDTIWLEITFNGFSSFEGGKQETETYYLPTEKKLVEANGGDWY